MQVCNENHQNTAEAYNFGESSGEKQVNMIRYEEKKKIKKKIRNKPK